MNVDARVDEGKLLSAHAHSHVKFIEFIARSAPTYVQPPARGRLRARGVSCALCRPRPLVPVLRCGRFAWPCEHRDGSYDASQHSIALHLMGKPLGAQVMTITPGRAACFVAVDDAYPSKGSTDKVQPGSSDAALLIEDAVCCVGANTQTANINTRWAAETVVDEQHGWHRERCANDDDVCRAHVAG